MRPSVVLYQTTGPAVQLADITPLQSAFYHYVLYCTIQPIGCKTYNKKVCYRWLHSAPRVKRETRILPIGGRCL